jgi:hypothetical protein
MTILSISLHVHNCTTQVPLACILIDRHRIEPLANLSPHLEELDMLAFWGWHATGSLALKRDFFVTTKQCPTSIQTSIHPKTQEQMELQLHQHFDTHIDHSCGLHKATDHVLYWIRIAKTMVPKKTQKCRNTGFLRLDKPLLRQRGHNHHFHCNSIGVIR